MPLAKIHVLEGQYDSDRLDKVSAAIQAALMNTLGVPPEDFCQLIFEFPRARFRHTPSFVGMHYSDDLIILDVTFIEGRPPETAGAPKGHQHSGRLGSQDLSGRPHDHHLRSSRCELLPWAGRSTTGERRRPIRRDPDPQSSHAERATGDR